jgi:hypothetical protein
MSERTHLQLSAAGLRNITSTIYEKTFQFIAGGRSYYCTPFVADFLSPLIGRTRRTDPLFDAYIVSTPDPLNEFGYFACIGEGHRVDIPSSALPFLLAVCRELGNWELIDILLSSNTSLCLDNAVIRFELKRSGDLNCESELKFICQHISEMWDSIQEILNVEMIFNILESDFLEIPTEDWLLTTLMTFIQKDWSRLFLISVVHFEMISVSLIIEFTKFMSHFISSGMTLPFQVWDRLCQRLICEVKWPIDLTKSFGHWFSKSPGFDICYSSGKAFQGIITHLRQKHNGDLCDLGIIAVTASSEHIAHWVGRNCIDHNSTKGFCSQSKADQWLQLDFKDSRIRVTHYSILSRREWGKATYHPMSWAVAVSEDGQSWSIVDHVERDDHLNGSGLEHTFAITTPTIGRYFRLRQTGPTADGYHYFTFVNLELFGRFFEVSQ